MSGTTVTEARPKTANHRQLDTGKANAQHIDEIAIFVNAKGRGSVAHWVENYLFPKGYSLASANKVEARNAPPSKDGVVTVSAEAVARVLGVRAAIALSPKDKINAVALIEGAEKVFSSNAKIDSLKSEWERIIKSGKLDKALAFIEKHKPVKAVIEDDAEAVQDAFGKLFDKLVKREGLTPARLRALLQAELDAR